MFLKIMIVKALIRSFFGLIRSLSWQLLQWYRDQWYGPAQCDLVFQESCLLATLIRVFIGRYLVDVVPGREKRL
jgi:hypothetical protein